MQARHSLTVVVSLVALLTCAACGGNDTFRIGVLTDCQGPLRGFDENELSGAQLPLIRRGARLLTGAPGGGVTTVDVAGRKVELVRGCSEIGEHIVFIDEARRLVEREHVDAVVGSASVVTRELARKYPEVPFVETTWEEQETTLRNPAPNLYRFAPDFGQQAAGLGAYAYHGLGWRRATVLAGDLPSGWGGAAAFIAEFCALGGRIDRQIYHAYHDPAGSDTIANEAVASGSDGVATFLAALDQATDVVGALLPRLDEPAKQLLLWDQQFQDPALFQSLGPKLDGVATTAWYPSGAPSASLAAYQKAYRQAFPRIPPGYELISFVIGYADAVEALLVALARTDGDLSDGRRRLRAALAHGEFSLPRGPVHLDTNRQVVTDTPLVRLRWRDKTMTTEPISVARDVEQTFGGLLADAPPPGPRSQPCRRARPPAWAR